MAGKKTSARRKKLSAEQRSFVNGKSESVTLTIDVTKVPKGADYVLQRPGSGAHGKDGKAKHRAERKQTRQQLRSGEDFS